MFDWKKPTVQMLGRWQPWHDGHTALFKKALAKTGQVAIMVRDVHGSSGGEGQDDNPFIYEDVWQDIRDGLKAAGYEYSKEYIVMRVPNIVDISYGRGVGYTFTEHKFGEDITSISATKIRAEMREKGEL
mgnify:FL=1|tara:strand:+ start:1722 stop:2111 length:390 start_codon:yes stop_codon:yes gene_type:complete